MLDIASAAGTIIRESPGNRQCLGKRPGLRLDLYSQNCLTIEQVDHHGRLCLRPSRYCGRDLVDRLRRLKNTRTTPGCVVRATSSLESGLGGN